MARRRASMREGPLAELFRATEAAKRSQPGDEEPVPAETAAGVGPSVDDTVLIEPEHRRESTLEATVEHMYDFEHGAPAEPPPEAGLETTVVPISSVAEPTTEEVGTTVASRPASGGGSAAVRVLEVGTRCSTVASSVDSRRCSARSDTGSCRRPTARARQLSPRARALRHPVGALGRLGGAEAPAVAPHAMLRRASARPARPPPWPDRGTPRPPDRSGEPYFEHGG